MGFHSFTKPSPQLTQARKCRLSTSRHRDEDVDMVLLRGAVAVWAVLLHEAAGSIEGHAKARN
ncbi:MAG: hypothetical protein QW109_05515 [Sulfolobales archaeon]